MPHKKKRSTTHRRPPGASRQRGFSLLEVVTVIAIITLAATVAIPVMSHIMPKQQMKGAARDLYSVMMRAKVEALKRGAKVAVQINPDDQHLYKLFVDNSENGTGNGRVDDERKEPVLLLGAALPARVIFLDTPTDSKNLKEVITSLGYRADYGDNGNPAEMRTTILFDHRGIPYMPNGQVADGTLTLCVAKSSANRYGVGNNEAVYGYRESMKGDEKALVRLRDEQCRAIQVNKTGRVRMITYTQRYEDRKKSK